MCSLQSFKKLPPRKISVFVSRKSQIGKDQRNECLIVEFQTLWQVFDYEVLLRALNCPLPCIYLAPLPLICLDQKIEILTYDLVPTSYAMLESPLSSLNLRKPRRMY